MGIKDLPTGRKFTTTGAGNFQTKLKTASRYGALSNLDKKNQKALADGVKAYGRAIRVGEFSRLRQLSAWRKIKASDKTITKEDSREIKEVLKHLGRGEAVAPAKMPDGRKPVKTSDGQGYLTKEQIARNLRARMQREADLTREETKTSFAASAVSTKSIGTSPQKEIGAARIGVKTGPIGFAGGQVSKASFGINSKS